MSDEERPKEGMGSFAFFVATVIAGYLGIFFLVVLDEAILGTRFLPKNLPRGAGDFFRTAYAPLIYLVHTFMQFLR